MTELLLRARWVAALLVAATPASAGAEARPIVAVFEIQAEDKVAAAQSRAALTDFLAARLTASGRFRTVPRAQIKQRLSRLRVESYRDCYDQACQIELGRELAANKALSTKLRRVGGRCLLTLELYDLKSAATDAAHTAETACDEATLFTTVGQAADALVRKAAATATTATSATAPATAGTAEQVSLFVRSEPKGADVLVDGLHRGTTPARLSLERGRRYRLTLVREDYRKAEREVVAGRRTDLDVPLELTTKGRIELAATSEWFGLGFGPGYVRGGDGAVLGVSFRTGNIKWHRFFWTLLDVHAALPASTLGPGERSTGAMTFGSRAGFPLYLGRRGQHQLLFGLGLGYTTLFEQTGQSSSDTPSTSSTSSTSSDKPGFFSLAPGIDYTYNAYDGLVPFGLGVRVVLPTAGDLGDGPYPAAITLTANVGFSLYRLLKSSKLRLRGATRPTRQDDR